jgi:hypothetical protein
MVELIFVFLILKKYSSIANVFLENNNHEFKISHIKQYILIKILK